MCLLGGVIFTVGFWLSKLAHDAIARVVRQRQHGQTLHRIAILGFGTVDGFAGDGDCR